MIYNNNFDNHKVVNDKENKNPIEHKVEKWNCL